MVGTGARANLASQNSPSTYKIDPPSKFRTPKSRIQIWQAKMRSLSSLPCLRMAMIQALTEHLGVHEERARKLVQARIN